MANRTQQRPSSTSRFPRSARAGSADRAARTGRAAAGGTGGRFARTSTASPAKARFGRPTPAAKSKGKARNGNTSLLDRLPIGGPSSKKGSSGKGLAALTSALGGASKKSSGGGGKAKGAGGLAALAGLAGLALKNRSKITNKLGSGKQSNPDALDRPESHPGH
jgi:hypothetical protein